MINMNSPTVQTIINSTGYNPFVNGQYVPQPQLMPRQNTYSSYNYDYNPYLANQRIQYQYDDLDNWQYTYDPMPKVVTNEARGINTSPVQAAGTMYNTPYNYNGYNNLFNGYYNPILMNNIAEQRRISEREEAINQGKIWRRLLGNVKKEDEEFNIDNAVTYIESLYYYEPYQPEMTTKEKIIADKNKHIAELESRLNYYRANNIPIITPQDIEKANIYNYYNHLNSIIGDANNCDMVDYFTRVYPEMKFEQLEYDARKFNKNLKNKYANKDFNSIVDKVSADKPDSYYYKLMESFSENGVKITNGDGLTMTPDQMEIRLPERLLRKRNKQDLYYEQRKKFYDSVFRKDDN